MSSLSPQMRQERKRLLLAGVIPLLFIFVFVFIHLLQLAMGWHFTKAGVLPRTFQGLPGIVSSIFIHSNWSHLGNNILAFAILSWAFFSTYRKIAIPVFSLLWVGSGALLWIIGRPVYHIGCSGLIYALAFFLFLSGILRKHPPLIALSLVVVFLYGGMIWQIFPWLPDHHISWEGHLAGSIVGLLVAYVFRHKGPQRPPMIDDDDEEDDNLNVEIPEWMVTHSLDDNIKN